MKDTVRTFIAVETSAAVRQRAAELIETLAAAGAKVSWVKPHNLHLTIKFLDEVRWNDIAEVIRAVQEAAAKRRAVRAGNPRRRRRFPIPAARARCGWARRRAATQLAALHAALESALNPLGFPKEHRRFAGHLTLGRVRDGGPGSHANLAHWSSSTPTSPPGGLPSRNWSSSPASSRRKARSTRRLAGRRWVCDDSRSRLPSGT